MNEINFVWNNAKFVLIQKKWYIWFEWNFFLSVNNGSYISSVLEFIVSYTIVTQNSNIIYNIASINSRIIQYSAVNNYKY